MRLMPEAALQAARTIAAELQPQTYYDLADLQMALFASFIAGMTQEEARAELLSSTPEKPSRHEADRREGNGNRYLLFMALDAHQRACHHAERKLLAELRETQG